MLPDRERLAATRLRLDLEGAVATVTLNAPERRNAQVPSMWHTLAEIGAGLPEEIRVVVLRGEGDGFSAGLDLDLLSPSGVPGEESTLELIQREDQAIIDVIGGYQDGFTWLHDPRFVSIAQVQGYAIGAGFQLALACDLRVVADDAYFCMKEPALGLVPDLAGTKPLVDLVGYSRALDLCATARKVGAVEADALGLVTRLVPAADLSRTTEELVAAIVANNVGAVRETTALLQGALDRDLETQRLAERTAQVRRFRELGSR